MKRIFNISVLLFSLQFGLFAQEPEQIPEANDPFYTYENIPSSPEVSSLGTYGRISASPYNGKAGVSVPIYSINFDGKEIPITLSYNSGGVKVNQEAGWVGLNWNLSGVFGISREIFGFDDFSDRVAGEYTNAPLNGYIYNNINPVLEEGAGRPYLDYNDILNVHHSFKLTDGVGSGSRFMDTQPDVFHLSVFGKKYNFILKKKASGNILETKIFNSNNAVITYDLLLEEFKLVDEDGFEYYFGTREINTTFSTVTETTPPSSYQSAFQNVFVETHRENESLTTNWSLDKVISPRGQILNFNYQKGLYFTFPQYSFDYDGYDHVIRTSWPSEQYQEGARKTNYRVTFTVIENSYLTKITGPFGRLEFNLENRSDLCTGSSIETISGGYFGLKTLYTANSQITACHGSGSSCAGSTSLPKRLKGISVFNSQNDNILNANFLYSYFDNNYQGVAERYLRLKLDKVSINNKPYEFNYLNSNSLVAKDSDGVDFWGYSNGKEVSNDGIVPKIGRFITSEIYRSDNSSWVLGQSFINYPGANRSSDFSFGKAGLLNQIKYPTGGTTTIQYEPNDIVLSAPEPFTVTEDFPNSNRLKWTNMIDESNFKPTYQYLKYAQDSTYNYFEKTAVIEPGNAITTNIELNEVFQLNFASLVEVNGYIETYTGWEGVGYWSDHPILVVEDINTGQEFTLFTYGNAPSTVGAPANNVSKTINLPPGEFRVVKRWADIPPGDNYEDYPPIPAVNFYDTGSYIHTFESDDPGDLSNFYERFEIGGARVSVITNRDHNNDFISSIQYDYVFPDGLEGLSSSGVLMDDLIFYKKTSGFQSYSPRGYKNFFLTGNNQVGGHNSAAGNHIGYSYVRELKVNSLKQHNGWVDYEFYNQKNEYFKTSFTLPYQYNTLEGTGDPYINILGTDLKWTCSGMSFGNDCAGETYHVSTHGNASIQNTVLLGLPLKADFSYSNGNILSKKIYDKQGILVSKTQNTYTFLKGNLPLSYYASFIYIPLSFNTDGNGIVESSVFNTTEGPWGANHHTYFPYLFPQHYGLTAKISSSETTEYFGSDILLTENTSSYNLNTFLLKEFKSYLNEIDFISEKHYYPYDVEVSSNTGMADLRNENRITTLIKREKYKNEKQLSAIQYKYDNSSATSNHTLATEKLSSKGIQELSSEKKFKRYDSNGRLLEYQKTGGLNSIILWGYKDQYPIAKIENATYDQISNALGVADLSTVDETYLAAINTLRDNSSLNGSMITTYTYDPLVGITTITDPRGNSTTYEYDPFGRLDTILDHNAKLLKEYKYNYKSN